MMYVTVRDMLASAGLVMRALVALAIPVLVEVIAALRCVNNEKNLTRVSK